MGGLLRGRLTSLQPASFTFIEAEGNSRYRFQVHLLRALVCSMLARLIELTTKLTVRMSLPEPTWQYLSVAVPGPWQVLRFLRQSQRP